MNTSSGPPSPAPAGLGVSAVITTYNQAPYVGDAVASALGQTLPPREVIVVDDGSTDDTRAALAPYRDRIHYVYQPNQGVTSARNAGVRLTCGDFVALLDGDDVWEPEKLAVQAAAAVAHPEAGLIVVDGEHFGHPDLEGVGLFAPGIRARLVGPGPVAVRRCHDELLRRNFISTTSQVMIPRRVLEAVGPSDASFPVTSDYDLYLRIAARYAVVLIDRRLTRWRYLATSVSGPHERRPFRWTEGDLAVWRKHLARIPRAQRSALRRQIRETLGATARAAAVHGRAGDRAWATRYLLRLWRRTFPSPTAALFLLAVWAPAPAIRLARALRPRTRP